MKILICEDEAKILTELTQLCKNTLHKFDQLHYQIEVYNTGEHLIKSYLKGNRADLLFLDIQLGTISGIEVARKIRQLDKSIKIVFATNFKNYQHEAFSVHAFGYIEKPFDQNDIESIITEVFQYSYYKEENLLHLHNINGDFLINKNDVLYIENQNRKLILVCFSGSYPISGKISKLAKDLVNDGFCRPHVSFLVNLDYVRRIKNYIVYMVNEQEIPLSQKRSSYFRKKVSTHLRHIVNSYKEETR